MAATTWTDDAIATAYYEACVAELTAIKPGNVGYNNPGHGMTASDFEVSARVSAKAMSQSGLTVGERIQQAVAHTNNAVGHNTNLGIVLLCAPLCEAARACTDRRDVSAHLSHVLNTLTVDDAIKAYNAIAMASPAGLGNAPQQDVAQQPTITLLEAMRLAADHDRVAWQYANEYRDITEMALQLGQWSQRAYTASITRVYLQYLNRYVDSHIARKHGNERAGNVLSLTNHAYQQLLNWIHSGDDYTKDATITLRILDRRLKSAGLNPGTSADLTVATLLMTKFCQPSES